MSGDIDQNQLISPSEAGHSLSGAADVVSTSPTQPPEQPTDPSCVSAEIKGRSKISTPSCNLCRRRKIKCDRSDPCAHCVRTGAVCITPAPSRAPRGRKGGRHKYDNELLDRIAKL